MKTIAIITGASSGLGREFTKQISMLKKYDEIWILARRYEKLLELADEINNSLNFKVIKPIAMDISSENSVYTFKQLLEDENEALQRVESGIKIGLLVNNAGFGTYGPFEESSIAKEMDMVNLNCKSLTGFCSIALPYLDSNSVIINTASLAAFLPLGNFAVYAASKAYVLSFSIALAAELKDKGIKVCALCPGSVSTEFANVASNGARKEVLGGIDPAKVVAHCIKLAYKGKKVALYRPKWRFTAFMSRFIGRYFGARWTYKFNKRPHTPETDISLNDKSVPLENFL